MPTENAAGTNAGTNAGGAAAGTPAGTPPAAGAAGTPPAAGGNVSTPPAAGASGATILTGAAGEADKSKAAPGAAGELELKPIDGLQLDDKTLGGFKTKAKELGLDSAKAQGILEFYASVTREAAALQQKETEALQKSWVDAVAKDPELGGANLAQTNALAARAFRQFGTKELTGFLEETGLGNHPELVRMFVRIGRASKEDSAGDTVANPGTQAQNPLAAMYPNSPSLFKK